MDNHRPIRIGLLGAARIADAALIRPVSVTPDVTVAAIAARDESRARRFAYQREIPLVHKNYADLIADPEIDAIYNPLPNSLHFEWTMQALGAGKHVLCEKPLASNADEAEKMTLLAHERGLILAEAFHTVYHPLVRQMRSLIDGGVLGEIVDAEAHFCTLLLRSSDIRYQFHLAGGAMMDLGCYTVCLLRYLLGSTLEVVSARAHLHAPQVDRSMEARLLFPENIPARITCSFLSSRLFRVSATVRGTKAVLRVINPLLPHYGHWLEVKSVDGRRIHYERQIPRNLPSRFKERVGYESTYWHQLQAFAAAIRQDKPMLTDGWYGVENMRIIDAIYEKAGLQRRGRNETV